MRRPAPLWRRGEPVAPLQALLARGGVLAVPTESSYGLAADPRNAAGVAAVYRIKGRAPDKALPVVVSEVGQLAALGIDPALPILDALAAVWPAPLSVVLPLVRPLPAAAGEGGLAVRVPAHAGLRELLAALGTALTATSANRSGEPPALTAEAAAELLAGEDAAVVDGGTLPGGAPSTLVEPFPGSPGGFRVLRPGAFPVERLRAAPEASPAGDEGTSRRAEDRS